MPHITAVCRVDGLLPETGGVGVTAIDKRPVDGELLVKKTGVFGDIQANRKHHGGPDKAVYVYADEDATHFADLLDREISPGLFGENLRASGLDVSGAVIGERWTVGDELVLEVTMPRTPCATFARRMREPRWVRRFQDEGRPGAYLKVVRAGPVVAGAEITVDVAPVARRHHRRVLRRSRARQGGRPVEESGRTVAQRRDARRGDARSRAFLTTRPGPAPRPCRVTSSRPMPLSTLHALHE